MSVDFPPDSSSKETKRARRSQLKVVLDTNSLYVSPSGIGSASDLVRQEVAQLIAEAKYPDLEVLWYIPEIVRHERQYQMQVEALKLRFPIAKIERLLGHNLALTDSVLLDHVKTKIDEAEERLGLQEIKLDHNSIDWPKLIDAAVYRKPPFETGEREKGFRDAIVAESFLQLVASSPRTPSVCRIVLVTSDALLTRAIKERLADSPNGSVLGNLDELRGLINTIVSNVGEEFIAQIRPKASKLFFVSQDDKSTLFYKERIREQLEEKFSAALDARPAGTTFRRNSTWYVNHPNFSRKEGRRVFWTSRIEVEVEAGTLTNEPEPQPTTTYFTKLGSPYGLAQTPEEQTPFVRSLHALNLVEASGGLGGGIIRGFTSNKVVSHKGRDTFEVLWSTEVTVAKDSGSPSLRAFRTLN
jgi:PIN domain